MSKKITPKCSLIIPTNRLVYLDEAIVSVLAQKNVNCEIIVVDDGAKPSIKSQIGSRFPQVKYIEHRKNLGLPAARNTGVKNATAKYITFLDCDDLLKPNYCEEMVRTCEKLKTKAIVCLPQYFFTKGFPVKRKILFSVLSMIRDLSIYLSYLLNQKKLTKDGFFLVQSSHVLFQKEILDRFPSDEAYLTAANDWKLMAQILAKEPVGILPKRLSKYRYHYTSQSQSTNKISKWTYYDRLLKEIPCVSRKGLFAYLFQLYNYFGKILLQKI
jgi:glycosyltransferase involved in cell wall biosynthesis